MIERAASRFARWATGSVRKTYGHIQLKMRQNPTFHI